MQALIFDFDGVVMAEDRCLDTPVGEVADAGGCSIAALCPCAHQSGRIMWRSPRAYVACVADAALRFLDAGLITEAEKDAVLSDAGVSGCGVR